MKKKSLKHVVILATVIFLIVAVVSLFFGAKYIREKMLESNESMAIDFAELLSSSFQITDEEVTYMKSLTFNEMEVDEINLRLMELKNNANMNNVVTNVYVVAPLAEDEVKYNVDDSTKDFFGYEVGTPLNAVWLLNGIFDEEGQFVATTREDYYRYTHLTDELEQAMTSEHATGCYSSDEWGEFITGYSPLFTTEGHYIGLLGVDVNPDQYQKNVQSMIFILMFAFLIALLALAALFVVYYLKYRKEQEARVYFDFYSRMSHDMRTPMNGILGMAHLAETEKDPAQLHDYFHKVASAGQYLLQLINDTLDISKISNGKMELRVESVQYQAMMESITDMVQNSIQENSLHFEIEMKGIEPEAYVEIDPLRFKQIFVNLLSNAVKFTPQGGTIRFTSEVLEKKENILHCRFCVSDTGIGMSDEFVKNSLFKPFEQEENQIGKRHAGSGLGLTIARMLVELMHGTIQVESHIQKGTTFIIDMDLSRAQEPGQTLGTAPTASIERVDLNMLQGKRILLCEDHPLNAEIASRLLENKGCVVDIAENGQMGVEKFQESTEYEYDAILMDIRMPVMDGLEATAVIRNLERKDAGIVPIIAMTANAYAEDQLRTRKAGMNQHLSKPIDPSALYQTLTELISEYNSKQ